MLLPPISNVPTALAGSHPSAAETVANDGSGGFRHSLQQILSPDPDAPAEPPARHRPAAVAGPHGIIAVARPELAAPDTTKTVRTAPDPSPSRPSPAAIGTILTPSTPVAGRAGPPQVFASAGGRPVGTVPSETRPRSTAGIADGQAVTAQPVDGTATDLTGGEPIPKAVAQTPPGSDETSAIAPFPSDLPRSLPAAIVRAEPLPTQTVAVTMARAAPGTAAIVGSNGGGEGGDGTVAADLTAPSLDQVTIQAIDADLARPQEGAGSSVTEPAVDQPSTARTVPEAPAVGVAVPGINGAVTSTIGRNPAIDPRRPVAQPMSVPEPTNGAQAGQTIEQTTGAAGPLPPRTVSAQATSAAVHLGNGTPVVAVPQAAGAATPAPSVGDVDLPQPTPIGTATIDGVDRVSSAEPSVASIGRAPPTASATALPPPLPVDDTPSGVRPNRVGSSAGEIGTGGPVTAPSPTSPQRTIQPQETGGQARSTVTPQDPARATATPAGRVPPDAPAEPASAAPAAGSRAAGVTEATLPIQRPVEQTAAADELVVGGLIADGPDAAGAAELAPPSAADAVDDGPAHSGSADRSSTVEALGSPRSAVAAGADWHPADTGSIDTTIAADGDVVEGQAQPAVDGKPRQSASAALADLLGDGPPAEQPDPAVGQRATAATATNAQAGSAGSLPASGSVAEVASEGPTTPTGPGNAAAVAGPTAAAAVQQRVADIARRPTAMDDVTAGAEAGSATQPAAAGAGDALLTRHPTLAAQAALPRATAAHVPLPADQVAVQIAKAAEDGLDRIRLQLRPAELGRVEVQMEVGQDGRLQAVITADRSDTLQALQRDARLLEQALQNAGFDLGSGDLSFRHGEDRQDQGDGRADPSGSADAGVPGDDLDTPSPHQPVQRLPVWQQGRLVGLDIRL